MHEDMKAFIEKYQKYYFLNDNAEECSKEEKESLGLKTIKNVTSKDYEEEIMQYLKRGEINLEVVLWKTGRQCDNQEKAVVLTGYGKEIDKEELKDYLKYIEGVKDKINEVIDKSDIKEAIKLASEKTPTNFGTVYILNVLFFVSKGKLPIYDTFAHKAVRSLLEKNAAPVDIYLGNLPSKTELNKVITMYLDYMRLVEDVFEGDINKERMFISRDIDRALWVYGHATKNYYDLNS